MIHNPRQYSRTDKVYDLLLLLPANSVYHLSSSTVTRCFHASEGILPVDTIGAHGSATSLTFLAISRRLNISLLGQSLIWKNPQSSPPGNLPGLDGTEENWPCHHPGDLYTLQATQYLVTHCMLD